MISRIGSRGYTEGTSRVQQAGTESTEARAQRATPRETASRSAAVVRISNDARARADSAGATDRARPLTGAAESGTGGAQPASPAETRATVEIEPVVAQPVPDFDVPEAAAAESPDASGNLAPARDAERTE
jgi:hypothetical protein